MRVIFLSSRLTQHQIPFCNAMLERCESFSFVQMVNTGESWEGKGGRLFRKDYPYLIMYNEDRESVHCELRNADAIIVSAPYHGVIDKETFRQTPVFVYLERFYHKNESALLQRLKIRFGSVIHHGIYQKYHPTLLCASGFCAQDAKRLGLYRNRCVRWGYFPECKEYDIQSLMKKKTEGHVTNILWAGRFLDLKHPEDAVSLALRLKENGYQFHMNIVGSGEMERTLRDLIDKHSLQNSVSLLGTKSLEEVRLLMEEANIYLFTSDFQEGWGAVLNEAMNSGCAVVASHAIGAVPFLLEDKKNGLIYQSGNIDMLFKKVKQLLDYPELQKNFGEQAYRTITEVWNAKEAAERFVHLVHAVSAGQSLDVYETGPCSRAECVGNDWYTTKGVL